MRHQRMAIEVESPEELGYESIAYNLAESSFRDRRLDEIITTHEVGKCMLAYTPHKGPLKLRSAIIDGQNNINANDVLVCSGAAMALYIIATTLLNTEDHLIVIRPNYGTNLETPRSIGCELTIIDLSFEDGFRLPLNKIESAIRKNTKLISITTPQNPSGMVIGISDIMQLQKMVVEHNCKLLIDETYRALNFKSNIDDYYATISNKIISVSSLSKAYGTPGLRIGWILCKDEELMHQFLAAKEQIILSNSALDEELAYIILKNKNTFLAETHNLLQSNLELLKKFIENNDDLFEWNEPDAGAVALLRVKMGVEFSGEQFKKNLYQHYRTLVGFGHWFELPDRYMRIGFGYPDSAQLMKGLNNVKQCLLECM